MHTQICADGGLLYEDGTDKEQKRRAGDRDASSGNYEMEGLLDD